MKYRVEVDENQDVLKNECIEVTIYCEPESIDCEIINKTQFISDK